MAMSPGLDFRTKARIRALHHDCPSALQAAEVVISWGLNGCEEEALNYVHLLWDEPDTPTQNSAKGKSVATQLAEISEDMDFIRASDGDLYACIQLGEHCETWRVESRPVRDYLSNMFYQKTGKVPGAQAVQDSINVLRGRAQFAERTMPTDVRVQYHEGRVYLDLCNDKWQVVEITPSGWRVMDGTPPVLFRRPKSMRALPLPDPNGTLDPLWQVFNVGVEDRPLIASVLAKALYPRGPDPNLDIGGEHGRGKTMVMAIAKSVVDPADPMTRATPKDEQDLMIAAQNQRVLAYDNLSSIPPWLSDAFCRLSTGAGMATRQLYTDDEEKLFTCRRIVMFNGIGETATRPDLLDRSIVIQPPEIPPRKRRQELELWEHVAEIRPQVLGALLNAVVAGLATEGTIHLSRLPRMADFATFAAAALPAVGFPADEFLRRYDDNRAEVSALALEASPIGAVFTEVVRDLTESGSWTGTYRALLVLINEKAEARAVNTTDKAWPKNARSLSTHIKRLAPSLSEVTGIQVSGAGHTEEGSLVHIVRGEADAPDTNSLIPSVVRVEGVEERGTVRESSVSSVSCVSVRTEVNPAADANGPAADANGPAADANDPAERPSQCLCGSVDFWRRPNSGEWVCARCHPRPPTSNETRGEV